MRSNLYVVIMTFSFAVILGLTGCSGDSSRPQISTVSFRTTSSTVTPDMAWSETYIVSSTGVTIKRDGSSNVNNGTWAINSYGQAESDLIQNLSKPGVFEISKTGQDATVPVGGYIAVYTILYDNGLAKEVVIGDGSTYNNAELITAPINNYMANITLPRGALSKFKAQWTMVSGSSTAGQNGIYGTKGTPAPANTPGARDGAVSWTDMSGNLWIFGGFRFDPDGLSYFNDLWRFDGSKWTWISGSNITNQTGIYGSKGAPTAANTPGSRHDAVSWTDRNGNLWLFGGYGYDTNDIVGTLNDLWKFDGSNWTWVSGSNSVNQSGNYGTNGIPSPNNTPGARNGAAAWTDQSGNLWLFGGRGFFSGGIIMLNDLWKYDGNNWTWVSGGSNLSNQTPIYGSRGVSATTNRPGSRDGAVSWTDRSGNLWLYGGLGYGSNGTGYLNDLWKFDGSNWTWVSGSNIIDQAGSYGAKGTPTTTNVAGARYHAVSWIDGSGNLWLFGGSGYDNNGSSGYLNDLWKFDGVNWTWVSGSNSINSNLTPSWAYMASARYHAVSWIDGGGNLWLFGGNGYDSNGGVGYLNDLRLYLP